MGRRGPQPQPTALKLARGVPGHHALNHDEPELDPPTATDPPKEMTGRAREEWVRLVDILIDRGVLTVGDMSTFEEYCCIVGELHTLKNRIRSIGRTKAKAEHSFSELAKLRTQRNQYADRLGLTPSSRAGVKAVKTPKDAAETKRSRFFGARKEKPA